MGFTHGSVETAVSDNIMEGALLIRFAKVSISTGTMLIWVATAAGRDKVFEKATVFVDGATNAFAA
jgi:hypothetical protein